MQGLIEIKDTAYLYRTRHNMISFIAELSDSSPRWLDARYKSEGSNIEVRYHCW